MALVTPLLAANLHLLVCPVCHAALKLSATTVDCTGCLRQFPIVDGLPVLIASRAASSAQAPDPETVIGIQQKDDGL